MENRSCSNEQIALELERIRQHIVISERDDKGAEESLRESDEGLIAYLEKVPDGIYIIDLEGIFLYGNKRLEEISGYSEYEQVGKSYRDLKYLPSEYFDKLKEVLSLNFSEEVTKPSDLEIVRRDGTCILVQTSFIPIQRRGETIIIGHICEIA